MLAFFTYEKIMHLHRKNAHNIGGTFVLCLVCVVKRCTLPERMNVHWMQEERITFKGMVWGVESQVNKLPASSRLKVKTVIYRSSWVILSLQQSILPALQLILPERMNKTQNWTYLSTRSCSSSDCCFELLSQFERLHWFERLFCWVKEKQWDKRFMLRWKTCCGSSLASCPSLKQMLKAWRARKKANENER